MISTGSTSIIPFLILMATDLEGPPDSIRTSLKRPSGRQPNTNERVAMEPKPTPPSHPFPPRAGTPRYFHLLWEADIEDLQPVLESIHQHRDQVLERWHGLYVLHFGDSRSLSRTEFMEIFGNELDCSLRDLLNKDIDRFAADVRQVGEILADR